MDFSFLDLKAKLFGKGRPALRATFAVLSLAFAASPSWAAPQEERFQEVPHCEQLLRDDSRQQLRNQFVQKYGSKVYAAEDQNLQWISDISRRDSSPHFYVTMENAQLKKLNDQVILDKDLVTALTNFHKEIFLSKMKALLAGSGSSFYSDFKSVRWKVTSAPAPALLEEIESAMTDTNREFFGDGFLRKIVRESDLQPADWFTLGIGSTEGEASLAARGARGGSSASLRFEDAAFQSRMQWKLLQFKDLHQKLAQGKFPLSLDAFVQCRKNKTPQKLKTALKEEFPQAQITSKTAKDFLTYCEWADEFSPSLLTPKREVLTIDEAPYGVMSLDFIGLGAENLKATAEALLRSGDISQAMVETREGEQAVTKSFLERKKMVSQVVESHFGGEVSLRFSGDDGIIVPERAFELRDQIQLLEKLSGLLPYSFFRMSTISASSSQKGLSPQLISQAESIEKALRPLLRRALGAEASRKIHVNVFNTSEEDVNKVYLILHIPFEANRGQVQLMYALFNKALKYVEREIRQKGQPTVFEAGDIFSTHEKKRH